MAYGGAGGVSIAVPDFCLKSMSPNQKKNVVLHDDGERLNECLNGDRREAALSLPQVVCNDMEGVESFYLCIQDLRNSFQQSGVPR